ncbi:MAG: hypothetical protein IKS41_03340 [Alphaproteobacteria bacterium]|nr:hypothetical protein [Alphaproteobacteria bacterium]
MTDEHLIDGSRDYDCCRYFDLIKRIDSFYADGVITADELNHMRVMRSETLINYQVAQELKKTMDPKAPDYGKLNELIDYLRRCWQTMDMAYDRGIQLNQSEPTQPTPDNKKLSLNLDKEKTDLLSSVLHESRFSSKNIDDQSLDISPLEKEKAMGRVVRALKMLERDKMNQARAHMSDMEHTKK